MTKISEFGGEMDMDFMVGQRKREKGDATRCFVLSCRTELGRNPLCRSPAETNDNDLGEFLPSLSVA
jgi:hypothetical protein